MRPNPPILSASEELVLPDLEIALSGGTIPTSADLATLNEKLASVSTSAAARADALRRDVQILQQTYSALRARLRSEAEAAAQAEKLLRQASQDAPSEESSSMDGPALKKRKSDLSFATPISKLLQTPFRQPSPSTLPTPKLELPDRAEVTVELATTSDPEELKRRLGVAYYPTQDLSHLLPGTPSTEDYSKQKIPNQVAMSTFQTSIDPFFRLFTEEDLGWLRGNTDKIGPFIIPPLGTHYSELWNDQTSEDVVAQKPDSTQKPRDTAEALTDENVSTDAVSCGPLTSRLLSALIKEDGTTVNGVDKENADKEKPAKSSAVRMDYSELEDKLTSELNFIGLLDGNAIDWSQSADDEISAELRSLQAKLQIQMDVNITRKQKLRDLTRDEMAKDEYTTILDDLDKQVEQAFLKRTRSIKATKKKRVPNEKGLAMTKVAIGGNIRSLLEKRHKWITRIGSICTTEPVGKTSVFQDLDDDQSEE